MDTHRSSYRRNGRARIGIAAAVLVGGSAIAVVAVAATSHGPALATQSASYSAGDFRHSGSEWSQLNSAIGSWSSARQDSLGTLASLTQQTLSQTTAHEKTLDIQRGIVVLATPRFIILQSSNGSLHLWTLSGNTKMADVSGSMTGTAAMMANSSAAQQAVTSDDMGPAANLMAGSPLTAAQLLTPSAAPQTVTVQVAGTDLTVTVTVTKNMATISQTATTPASGAPAYDPATTTQSAWATAGSSTMLARGDLALLVGTRSHDVLHAEIVLYTPLSAGDVGGTFKALPAATSAGTHW
jgi:hypothetical protein